MGDSQSNGIVTVNLQPTQRHGEYWYRQIAVTNAVAAQYPVVKAVGVLPGATTNGLDIATTTAGHEFVPQSPEIFGYDSDGNLTNDGRWAYTWDAENRLVQMQTSPNLPAAVPRQTLLFGYDFQGRRISKVVSNYSGSAWTAVSNFKFVYDGWNLVAELDGNNNPVRTYMWGLDLSGSEQGAGGVGGLLAVNAGTNGTQFVAYDGNGNVTALVGADTGAVSAQHEYGPFGETLRTTGAAAASPFRFSTKYTDSETRLLYYGYRYYNPSTGRWLSRDPLNAVTGTSARLEFLERSGLDPDDVLSIATSPSDPFDYSFAYNQPVISFDVLGLRVTVPLPDSGPGTFDGGTVKLIRHKITFKHYIGATLTFTVCCEKEEPYLTSYGQSSPLPPPPPTANKNTFPYWVATPPSGSGPCYTITVEVPTTTAFQFDWNKDPGASFIPSIRIVGRCSSCSDKKPPELNNPPTTPPSASPK